MCLPDPLVADWDAVDVGLGQEDGELDARECGAADLSLLPTCPAVLARFLGTPLPSMTADSVAEHFTARSHHLLNRRGEAQSAGQRTC